MANKKRIIREGTRKIFHIIIGIGITLLAYNSTITGLQIVGVSLLLMILSILFHKHPIRSIEKIIEKYDRKDIIPGYGAIMLGLGIGASFIIFHKDIALIAGICVSMTDGISTIVSLFQDKALNKRSIYGTITGSIASFALLSSFYAHISIIVIVIAALTSGIIDYYYDRIWIVDDNVVMPLVTGAISYVTMILLLNV